MDSMSNRHGRQPAATRSSATETRTEAPQQVRTEPSRPAPVVRNDPPKRNRVWKLLAVAALIVLLLGAVWYAFLKPNTTTAAIDSSKYQAVFFTNGQVYFGKLSSVNDDFLRLKDVYYLQTKAKETKEDDNNPQPATSQDASDVELIKLGSEIHGPADEMIVSRDQVLFFENLKSEGNVSKTITTYKKQNPGTN